MLVLVLSWLDALVGFYEFVSDIISAYSTSIYTKDVHRIVSFFQVLIDHDFESHNTNAIIGVLSDVFSPGFTFHVDDHPVHCIVEPYHNEG